MRLKNRFDFYKYHWANYYAFLNLTIKFLIILLFQLRECESGNDVIRPPSEIKQDWKIVFYTGDKVWAGTDSEIYVELIGDMGNSQIIRIRPKKHQLEADGVDIFSLGDLDGKQIGNLKSIIVGKQHSYSFFNDWQLVKIEIYDPYGKKYVFNCNCWLTTLKYKRIINLSLVEGIHDSESDDSSDSNSFTTRNTKVFPATIGILFILLILIVFTYFGNEICKKWRENILYFSANGRNRDIGQATTLSPRSGERTIYRNVDTSANIPLSTAVHNIIDDKPPEYKDLFPLNQNILNLNSQSESADHTVNRQNQNTNQNITTAAPQQVQIEENSNTSQTKFTSV